MNPRNRRPPPPQNTKARGAGSIGSRPEPTVNNTNLIYGVLPVLEALRADHRRIDKVLLAEGAREHRLSEIIDECRSRSIPYTRASRDAFIKLAGAQVNHQGVIAFTASAEYVGIDEIFDKAGETPLIVVLD